MSPSGLLLHATAATTALTALLAHRRRGANATAGVVAALLTAITLWTSAVGTLYSGVVGERWLGPLGVLQWVGIAMTICFLRAFCDLLVRRSVTRARRRALLVEPVLVAVALALDPWLHLVYTSVRLVGQPPVRQVETGPLYWVFLAYHYLVVATVCVDLVRHRRRCAGRERRVADVVLVGLSLPLLLNAYYQVERDPSRLDMTPAAFGLTALVCSVAVFRRQLLHLVPVARAVVMDTVSDAVLVVAPDGYVLDANRAASALLGVPTAADTRSPLVGTLLDAAAPALMAVLHSGGTVALPGGVEVDVRSRRIIGADGGWAATVLAVRDVTRARVQERSLQAALAELQHHVRTIEHLQAELADEARRDALTGLRNRRGFADELSTAVRAALATGGSVSVVLADVDHFKAVNDTHGHARGDEVLVGVARLLAEHFRSEDVFRYGGEEFVVVLPGVGADAAVERADALRAAVAARPVAGVAVTLSAGVATCPVHGAVVDELLRAADEALYEAKGSGRDRVVRAAGARALGQRPDGAAQAAPR